MTLNSRKADKGQSRCQIESKAKARQDDLDRADRLLRAQNHPLVDGKKARSIARKLSSSTPQSSPASRVYMQPIRQGLSEDLLGLATDPRLPPAKFLTILPGSWEIAPEELHLFDLSRALERLRKAISRQLPQNPSGYFFGFFDVDFALEPHRFRIHMHAQAAGDYVEASRKVRKTRTLASPSPVPNCDQERPPVQVKSIVPGTEVRAASYVVKSAWFRAAYRTERGRAPRTAIPNPYHAQLLVCLDQFTIEDMTLKMGLRDTKDGFKLTR